jgi:hypothetical protein
MPVGIIDETINENKQSGGYCRTFIDEASLATDAPLPLGCTALAPLSDEEIT